MRAVRSINSKVRRSMIVAAGNLQIREEHGQIFEKVINIDSQNVWLDMKDSASTNWSFGPLINLTVKIKKCA